MNINILKMIDNNKVYAIIPARSGSKGIKDKNISLLNGYPLFAYSIAAAKKAKLIDRVIVSTDSEKYAELAKDYGAETPFLRPKEISGDQATDLEFMQQAIEWFYENENYVPAYWVHLRPTCPLRKDGIIDDALRKIMNKPSATALLSVDAPTNILTPYKWLLKDGENLKSIFFDTIDDANRPRQSYPEAYMRTVIVDILKTETIVKQNSLFGNEVLCYESKNMYDIDDLRTFKECEDVLRQGKFDELTKYLRGVKREDAFGQV